MRIKTQLTFGYNRQSVMALPEIHGLRCDHVFSTPQAISITLLDGVLLGKRITGAPSTISMASETTEGTAGALTSTTPKVVDSFARYDAERQDDKWFD